MDPARDESKLDRIRRHFRLAAESDATRRKEGVECARFYLGDQWPSEIVNARKLQQRPCLTINRIPEFVAQVVNEFRQQRPEIRVSSQTEGDEAKETAEVLEDYVRFIQRRSDAHVAYDVGFQNAVIRKAGWVRIRLEYVEGSWDQDIYIDPVQNPDCVYVDPSAERDDASDARFLFYAVDLPKEEYRAMYGESAVASPQFQAEGDQLDWVREDRVRIAEYYYVVEKDVDVVNEATGQTRKDTKRSVKWCKTNGVEILEEGEFPGTSIPFRRLVPDRMDMNGQTHWRGMVDDAMDPARMANFWMTKATEAFALGPAAPYLATPEQIEGHEAMWAAANTSTSPFLLYNAVDVKGQPLGAPQRQQYEPPIMGMVQMYALMEQGLKSTMRIYNAGLGDAGPEQSGKAILARKQQSNIANLNYSDNAARWIRSIGQLIVDLIPLVISGPRLVAALAMDGQDRTVWLNQPFRAGAVEKIYDVKTSKFYVHVHTGPTYETKRQEAAAAMIEMAKADPTIMQIAGDLVVGAMDWPGADKIADRKRKMLPPPLQEQEDSGIPPQVQAQMAQLFQQNQQLTAALNEASQVIEQERTKIDSQERIAAMNAEVKLVIEEMKLAQQGTLALMQGELAAVKHKLDLMQAADRDDRAMEQAQMAQQGVENG